MKLKTILAVVLIFSLMGLGNAYEVINRFRNPAGTPTAWSAVDMPVPYQIHLQGTPDVPGTNEFAQLRQALTIWNRVSRLKFRDAGTTNNVRSFDLQNGIIFDQNFELDDSVLAFMETIFSGEETNRRVEGDLHFNDRDFRWTTATSNARNGIYKILPTTVHEIGHSVGLGHSAIFDATMFFADQGDDRGQSLHKDDKLGAKFIYNAPQNTLAVPNLLTPPTGTTHTVLANTSTQAAIGITFRWAQNTTNSLRNFVLEFAGDANFTKNVKRYTRQSELSYFMAPGAKLNALKNIQTNNGEVFWRVSATNAAGATVRSAVFRFKLNIVNANN